MMVWKSEDEEKHAECLKFFGELESKKIYFREMHADNLVGVGFLSSILIGAGPKDEIRQWQEISYMMYPTYRDREGYIVWFPQDKESIVSMECVNITAATRRYEIVTYVKGGKFQESENIVEPNPRIREKVIQFMQLRLPEGRVKAIDQGRQVYPLYQNDLDKILQYVREDK